MNAKVAERLQAIYAAADAAVAAAGPRCDASGRCCRFREYGHTLFISQIEADYLREHAPAFDGPLTDAACPYQVENLCTAREWRPLGCRVYFCDPNYQETGAAISERGVRELKMLADEYGLGWQYAPLHAVLPSCHSDWSSCHSERSEESGSQFRHSRAGGNPESSLALLDSRLRGNDGPSAPHSPPRSTDRLSLAIVE